MNRKAQTTVRTLMIWLMVSVGAAVAGDFDLSWFTIDGGGEMFSTGGLFELSGTIGQPDAAMVMTGGDFELVGGFWAITGGTVPPACVGDLNGDGRTDLADLGILLGDFGCTTPPGPCVGDLNGDGNTDLTDLGILLGDFGCMP